MNAGPVFKFQKATIYWVEITKIVMITAYFIE